jgi:hypothetical protein
LAKQGTNFSHADLVDLALLLQCGTEPSTDFLAKILDVSTPLFLCNIQRYFSYSLLLLHKSHLITADSKNSVCGMFACSVGNGSSILS